MLARSIFQALAVALLANIGAGATAWATSNWRLPVLSPDGSRVAAFELTANGVAAPPNVKPPVPLWQVAVRDTRAGALQFAIPLCTTCSGAGLAFAPDGHDLAILSHEERGRTTTVRLANNGVTRPLTTVSGSAVSPRWAPDGKSLAMLVTISPRKEPGATEAGSPMTGEIGWRTDVQRIALVSVEGSVARLVSPPDLYVYDYDWLPDGSGFVTTAASGNGDANWWLARLVAIDRASGTPRDIARPTVQIAAPTILADGKTLAFIGGLMSDRITASGDVWTVPLAGGAPTNITRGFTGSITGLARTNDGLVATAIIGLKGAIIAIDPDRGVVDPPLWTTLAGMEATPASFDASGTHVALVAQGFIDPPVLLVGPTRSPGPVIPSTDGGGDGTAPVAADSRSLEWTRDGQTLQGWLITPRGPAKGLIVEAHGGPTTAALPDWLGDDLRGDIVKAGYALFLPNPRGSAGRGEAFKALVKRDFGGGDLADILAGLDVATKAAGVAPDRTAMMGTSYGGFLAMLANTRTRAFKAIVAGAGISDWQSYYGQNGISEWMLPFFGASAYDDPAAYAAASPIQAIRQAKTPTLLFVGERDIETPPAQSLQYWHALKVLNVPATLMIYPGEGHAITDVRDLTDLRRRVIGWFDRWIAP